MSVQDPRDTVSQLTGGHGLGRGLSDHSVEREQWRARARLLGSAIDDNLERLPAGHPARRALAEALMRAGFPGGAARLAHERSALVPYA